MRPSRAPPPVSRDGVLTAAKELVEHGVAPERRPYRSPTLRHLGCVRDLVLGGASGAAEGAGTFRTRPM